MKSILLCLPLLLACLTFNHLQLTFASCPWKSDKLKNWNSTSSWESGSVPLKDEDVVIPDGSAILLNVQPPRLGSITIEPGGSLIWGDVDGITIETNYILVQGEFHIGSEDCRFKKQANVVLYGQTNSAYKIDNFGRKFIGVDEGGTLEIHGLPKTSWTKLTTTVGPAKSCGLVYDSNDHKFSNEKSEGLHITVWNKDGSLLEHALFATEHPSIGVTEQQAIPGYLKELPDDKVIAIAVYQNLGNVDDTSQKWDLVYSAIEKLGGSVIRKVKAYDAYALIAVTGDPSSAKDKRTIRKGNVEDTLEAMAKINVEERNLTFAVKSIVTPQKSPNMAVFRVVQTNFAFPVLTLMHDVSSWKPGDQIVIASTDYDWRQAEVRTIIECKYCTSNQVRVDGEFTYTHFGEITYNVDERAEVGLLSRNIRIEGTLEDSCYSHSEKDTDMCNKFGQDTFGGHLKILRNHTSVHIEGAEFFHMGQQAVTGSYPIHFHMCDDVTGMYLRNNSIHESMARCVTIHGTDGLEVSDHVCYRHRGHGYFLEDSAEQNNTLNRNLGIGTMFGSHIMSDMKREWCLKSVPKSCGVPSTFWITHPNNIITNNVAAGSDMNGMMITFSDVPLGPSYNRQKERGLFRDKSTRYIKIKDFSGNTMHSNKEVGLFLEHRISPGVSEGGLFYPVNSMLPLSHYSARDPPTADGQRIETVLTRLTFYKNTRFSTWLRCGNVAITQSTFADSPTGFIAAHVDGTTSCDVRDSIFVGQTDNKGEPLVWYNTTGIYASTPANRPKHEFDSSFAKDNPEATVAGVKFYQGPVFVDNCYFDRYFNWFFNDSFIERWGNRPVRPAAAISFHTSNGYPSMTWSGVSRLKFGYCDGVDNGVYMMHGNRSVRHWDMSKDGSVAANIRDYDGSLTGAPKTQVVRDRPFFTGDECRKEPRWGMAVCPYKYVMVSVIGNDGVLDSKKSKTWPILINRDDEPKDIINLMGKVSNFYSVRANSSYTLQFNTSLGNNPTYVRLTPFDLEKGDVIRLALCFPKATTQFKIHSQYPRLNPKVKPNWVSSVAEVDADTTGTAYFWDNKKGYLYLKLMSNYTRTSPDEQCPEDKCPKIYIYRLDGGTDPVDCDVSNTPYRDGQDSPQKPSLKKCTSPDSAEGLGSLNPEDVTIPNPPSNEKCHVPDTKVRGNQELRGCFMESHRMPDFKDALIKLYATMTPGYCMDRCFQRGYYYAGISYGSRCMCSNSIGRIGTVPMSKCSTACSGDQQQTCGASSAKQVYTTGAALMAPPKRCGPANMGVVFQDVCLYIRFVKEEYPDALRTCRSLGGTLTKIDSAEKQHAIELYLLGVTSNVWTGAANVKGKWTFLDGQRLSNYENWEKGQGVSEKKTFLKLQGNRGFKWYEYAYQENNFPLCDLPLLGAPPLLLCGVDNKGLKRGKGNCYALGNTEVTYEQAAFSCHQLFGRLAPAVTDADKASVERFLQEFGNNVDYWVDGGRGDSGLQDFYDHQFPHQLYKAKQRSEYGFICLLDEVSDIKPCPTGWIHNGTSCYLNKQVVVKDRETLNGYCNSERTNILSIDSQEENKFIHELSPDHRVWLDLQYKSFADAFVRSDGTENSFSNWAYSNPLQDLSKGLCVHMKTKTGQWTSIPCNEIKAYVICETPTFTQR